MGGTCARGLERTGREMGREAREAAFSVGTTSPVGVAGHDGLHVEPRNRVGALPDGVVDERGRPRHSQGR